MRRIRHEVSGRVIRGRRYEALTRSAMMSVAAKARVSNDRVINTLRRMKANDYDRMKPFKTYKVHCSNLFRHLIDMDHHWTFDAICTNASHSSFKQPMS